MALALMAGSALAQQSAPSAGPAIAEVQGADAVVRGAVTVSANGTTVMSGSQITAGATSVTLKLTRGGELKVCAGASITLTASASGREALVGLSNGTIETRYRLASNADTIVTPDFRLLLAGPGDFHFAIGMRGMGDMCVKSLSGNSAALIVNEVFGEGSHQVKPGEAVLFSKGSVQGSAALPAGESCGCATAVAKELGFPEQQSQTAAAAIAAGQPPPQPAPLPGVTTKKDEVITKVDAPIVFRGDQMRSSEPAPAPEAQGQAAAPPLPSEAKRASEPPKAAESAIPAPKPAKKKWYQKLGSALARIFR